MSFDSADEVPFCLLKYGLPGNASLIALSFSTHDAGCLMLLIGTSILFCSWQYQSQSSIILISFFGPESL